MDLASGASAGGFDNWQARLDLAYARTAQGTVPIRRVHQGPLRVQKHLYPEGTDVCQHIIVHPPGGIAGGDSLQIDVALGNAAHALITSPGAAKWYRGFGRSAQQTLSVHLDQGAILEWLPQETILFNGAEVAISNRFELAADARLLTMEVVCLGRRACAELFLEGIWRQKTEIRRDGKLLWHEQIVLPGSSPLLDSPIGLGGDPVAGNLIWAGPALPQEITDACRRLEVEGRLAVTQLPHLWVARYLGPGSEAAHTALRAVWALVRPAALGRTAMAPRIWAT
ncbi:MAG: urease accessory protein UreD [Formivibrio sp.]|nr:urease accessory protein UreD [Formivibrio sp.]